MSERDERRPVTLLVPGPWADERPVADALGAHVEWIPNDGGFVAAFSHGRVPAAALPRIAACAGAALVVARLEPGQEGEGLRALAERLRPLGAYGVRVEDSKAAWGLDEWLAELAGGGPYAAMRAVVVVAGDGSGAYTSGMHVFGLPDATFQGADAGRFVWMLGVYQLLEDPVLLSGHTFAPDADTPRQVLERWPDDRFPRAAPCHNPFGVWRVGAPALPGRQLPDKAISVMPALVVTLTAMEQRAGRPLTRAEVEDIVANAPSIVVEHSDARRLERARGYADIDPELAWAQWQVARRGSTTQF